MHNYRHEHLIQLFWSEEDDGYIAAVADWPGQIEPNAFGDTKGEALAALGMVLDLREEYAREGAQKGG